MPNPCDGDRISSRSSGPRVPGRAWFTLDVVGMAEERGIWPLHAGVNVGRVVQRDGDLFGTAVNVASRIAEEAKPGEVVVSRSVVDAAEPVEGIEFDEAGGAQLNNISVPVELFRARRSPID